MGNATMTATASTIWPAMTSSTTIAKHSISRKRTVVVVVVVVGSAVFLALVTAVMTTYQIEPYAVVTAGFEDDPSTSSRNMTDGHNDIDRRRLFCSSDSTFIKAADCDPYHTDNYASPHYNYTQKKIEAAAIHNADDIRLYRAAPCSFPPKGQYLSHFPHTMQTIYPCFDFWIEHKNFTPLFIYHDHQKGSFVDHPSKRSSYNDGIFKILRSKLGLLMMSMSEYQNSTTLYHPDQTIQSYTSSTFRNGYFIQHIDEWHNVMMIDEKDNKSRVKKKDSTTKVISCSGDGMDTSSKNDPISLPTIRILNRKINSRKIVNADEIAQQLTHSLTIPSQEQQQPQQQNPFLSFGTRSSWWPSWWWWRRQCCRSRSRLDVEVIYMDGVSFEQQVSIFQSTDILITGHGAALTGIIFMGNKKNRSGNKCSQLLEMFPENFALPSFFGTLAIQANIAHSYMYLLSSPSQSSLFLDKSSPASQSLLPAYRDDQNNVTASFQTRGMSITTTDEPLPRNTPMHDNRSHGTPDLWPWEIAFYKDVKSQKIARVANLQPNITAVVDAVQQLVNDWYQCHDHRTSRHDC